MYWLLYACVDPTVKADGPLVDLDTAADTAADTAVDTAGSPTWTALPATCGSASGTFADPLALEGQARVTQDGRSGFMEALDVELDGDTAYVVGMGGLLVFDISDPAAPRRRFGPADTSFGKLHRVEVLTPGFVATSQRELGVYVWDVSVPEAATIVGTIAGEGMEGLAWVGERLWVAVRGEGVRAYDLSDPTSPVEVARAPGLGATWELASTGDGWLYAADNTLGVVPIDIRDPSAPVVGTALPFDGAVMHVRYDEERLYVARGGDGVTALDVADRAAPVELYTVESSGTAVMTDVADGRLWVVDHEGLLVFDAAEGAPIQQEDVEQFALAVAAEGPRAFVGDWNLFDVYALDPTIAAPALDLPSKTLRILDGAVVTTYTNRGAAPLTLSGATVADSAAVVEVSSVTLAPGASGSLRLSGVTGDTELCLASDDPDEPALSLAVRSSAAPPAGVPAPDFALPDLDGNTHRLSEQLGAPVLLAYFATW